MFKQATRAAALALVLSLGSVAAAPFALAGPTYTGAQGDIALSGYDAVSYFTGDGTPVRGTKAHSVTYRGAQYYFASAANAEKFKKNPDQYAPQYGGHCAWAASRGKLAPGDPSQYKVVDGKLYLNFNANVQQTWLKDVPGYIAKADKAWPSIPDNARYDD